MATNKNINIKFKLSEMECWPTVDIVSRLRVNLIETIITNYEAAYNIILLFCFYQLNDLIVMNSIANLFTAGTWFILKLLNVILLTEKYGK